MDKSKEYIKMCDCEEIQKLQPKSKGDLYYIYIEQKVINYNHTLTEEFFEYYNCDGFTYGESLKGGVCWHKEGHITTEYFQDTYGGRRTKKILWIPRQDQLQDIYDLPINMEIYYSQDNYCIKYSDEDESLEYVVDNTWEKFWLCLVMWLKYNKRFNGENWE